MDPVLSDQARRDLRWLVDCPDLLGVPESVRLEDPFALGGEFDWRPVEHFLESKASHRVGYYVETLVQVWLESLPGIDEVRRGIQVRDGRETLGEIDLLYRRDGRLQHLEVALKFYLFVPDREVHGSHFIGPNAADTFERKRNRMLGKQLPLGRSAFPDVTESRALVKGVIFYRADEEVPGTLPEGLSPSHARGTWFRQGEKAVALEKRKCLTLRRPNWLAAPPRFLEGEVETSAGDGVVEMASVGLRCEEQWRETERVLIVPDAWPEKLPPAVEKG